MCAACRSTRHCSTDGITAYLTTPVKIWNVYNELWSWDHLEEWIGFGQKKSAHISTADQPFTKTNACFFLCVYTVWLNIEDAAQICIIPATCGIIIQWQHECDNIILWWARNDLRLLRKITRLFCCLCPGQLKSQHTVLKLLMVFIPGTLSETSRGFRPPAYLIIFIELS